MRLVINVSNLCVGGGVQVALSFIHELKSLCRVNEYHVLLSESIDRQIDSDVFPPNFIFHLIKFSPASLRYRWLTVSQLDKLERKIKPDVVFTIFGPSYWKPAAIHLMGVANGWLYNPESVAYKVLPVRERIRVMVLSAYRTFFIKRDASDFVVETNDARKKIVKFMGVNEKSISVVGNTYSAAFDYFKKSDGSCRDYYRLPKENRNAYRMILISHNYPQKNIKIIRDVVPYLSGYDIEFVLTIDSNSYYKYFNDMRNKVINIGPVKHASCPSLYWQSDALFFPTLLETFSAAYPEAMKMEIPIITSDYSFARDVCGDAALYFDPLDPKDIADKIKLIIDDESIGENLVEKGKLRLAGFETSQSRAEKYLTLCESLS